MSDPNQLPGPLLEQEVLPGLSSSYGGGGARAEESTPKPLLRLHRKMVGRYKWAVLIGVLLGGVFAYLGATLPKPVYRSEGLILVRPTVERGTPGGREWETESQRIPPMFDSFVSSQANLLRTPRVVRSAMEDARWVEMAQGADTQAMEEFLESLTVKRPPAEQVIFVYFDHTDKRVAQRGVEVIMRAYDRIYGSSDTDSAAQQLTRLSNYRVSLAGEIATLENRVRDLLKEVGTSTLDDLVEYKTMTLLEIQSRLSAVQLDLADKVSAFEAQQKAEEAGAGDEAVDMQNRAAQMTLTELARFDDFIEIMLADRDRMEQQLSQARLTMGINHRSVRQLDARSQELTGSKEEHAERAREIYGQQLQSSGLGGQAMVTEEQIKQLSDSLARLRRFYEQARVEAQELTALQMNVERLRSEMKKKQDWLRTTDQSIEALRMQAAVGGRIEIISDGDEPRRPHKDNRLRLGVFGAVAGIMLGFGVIGLISAFDRRLRAPVDAQMSLTDLTLLGVLPSLPDDLANPEHAAQAAYCVHHVRTLMQIGDAGGAPRHVFAVTGPTAGNGKTSLTLALGLSFAASGSRTLLVDCDFAGGGLTSRVEAIVRRKIGQVLLKQKLITEAQLAEALDLRAAQHPDSRLGEVLVHMGAVSQDDLQAALTFQEQTRMGLLDATSGEDLLNCIGDTGIPGISILPLGSAMPADASRVSHGGIQRLIKAARQHFDTVLIDTGPTPASVEASSVAPAVDAVVFVVSRGDQRPETERALKHLRSIGAQVAGLVFNRAATQDMVPISEMSTSAGGRRSAPVRRDGRVARFGPIANAVAYTSDDDQGQEPGSDDQ